VRVGWGVSVRVEWPSWPRLLTPQEERPERGGLVWWWLGEVEGAWRRRVCSGERDAKRPLVIVGWRRDWVSGDVFPVS